MCVLMLAADVTVTASFAAPAGPPPQVVVSRSALRSLSPELAQSVLATPAG